MREHRAVRPTEVRALDDSGRRFEALVVRYGVVDDFGTVFDPGVFAASLERRMPRITWAHDWSEPLGRYVDYTDGDDGLRLVGEFDDFESVPRARQASAQLRSGTIDQFSVGFVREETRDADDGLHFTRATLDEAALVLVGAVPGTKLLAVRSREGRREVPEDYVIDLAKKVSAGTLTKAEAMVAIDLAAGNGEDGDDGGAGSPAGNDKPPDEDGNGGAALAEAIAEADAALEGDEL